MTPKLIISGYPLRDRNKGVGSYTERLIEAIVPALGDAVKVVLPESLRSSVLDLPDEAMLFVPGTPPFSRPLLADIYWNLRIGAWSAERFPNAVFHAPAEFCSYAAPKRRISTLHDCLYRIHRPLAGGKLRRTWLWSTERWSARADRVLTDSEWSRNDLIALAGIPSAKIEVLPPYIPDRFGPSARELALAVRHKYRLPDRFWLYLGGFNINKNVDTLIATYGDAKRASADLPPLVLAGAVPGDLRLAVCDVAGAIKRAGVAAGDILTPGHIDGEDLPGLYAAAELFLFPSRYEGFGYPPAEALAVGTPVLVAACTSLTEIVTEKRCQFDPDRPEDIRAKMLEAGSDVGRFRQALDPKFRRELFLAAYLEVVEKLWGRPPSKFSN